MRHLVAVLLATLALVTCGGSTEPDGDGGSGGTDGGVYDLCSKSSECVIRPASCCGQCGAATRDDIVALRSDQVTAYQTATCGDSSGCPACYSAQDATLIATCDAGHCKVVDLKLHAATACSAASDCRIRTNVCCECGDPTDIEHIIAISSESEFSPLVCDGQACPECAPIYPAEVVVDCVSGHCNAAWPSF
jgi:hypothetical protein